MRPRNVVFIGILLGLVSSPTLAAAADERYILPLVPTQNSQGASGQLELKVDYDVVRAAPVSSKYVRAQPVCSIGWTPAGGCSSTPVSVLITSTWLRQFIADFRRDQRPAKCANYEPEGDPLAMPSWVPG